MIMDTQWMPLLQLAFVFIIIVCLFLLISWYYQRSTLKTFRERTRANQRLNLATSVAGLGVWEWDLRNNKLFWNPCLFHIYQIPQVKQLSLSEWQSKLKKSDGEKLESLKQLAGQDQLQMVKLTLVVTPDGQPRVIELVASGLAGDKGRLIGTQRDISDSIAMQRSMKQAAYQDQLTGLFNARALEQTLEKAVVSSEGEIRPFGLLFIDLDGFKQVNDTLGHDAGDLLLKYAAKRMRCCLRLEDEVFRLGGDEFVVWTPAQPKGTEKHALMQQLTTVAEKLKASLAKVFKIHERECHVSASIGGACFPYDATSAKAVMKCADQAMYQAKENGKNQFVQYVMLEKEQDTFVLNASIRTASEKSSDI